MSCPLIITSHAYTLELRRFLVEIPKGIYNGQKLMKLVRRKIPAKMSKITANVPLIKLER